MVATSKSIAENCNSVAISSNTTRETKQSGMEEINKTIRNIRSYVEKTNGDCEVVLSLVIRLRKLILSSKPLKVLQTKLTY